jgi:tartrate dehydratase beta subunit/fumarate hydratase class I family protein
MCTLRIQKHGGSMIMLAKGNRTNKLQMLVKPTVVLLRIYCGPAILAQDNILKVEIIVDFEWGCTQNSQ